MALAWALVTYPESQSFAKLAALFLAVEVLAWVLFVSAAVPGFSGTPEPVETIALICKAGELIGLGLAVAIGWPDQIAAGTTLMKALVRGAGPDSRAASRDARICQHADQRPHGGANRGLERQGRTRARRHPCAGEPTDTSPSTNHRHPDRLLGAGLGLLLQPPRATGEVSAT